LGGGCGAEDRLEVVFEAFELDRVKRGVFVFL
jgi:hypothetical protein